MKKVYVLAGLRTPQGKLGGALKDVPAQDLGIHVTKALLEKCPAIKEHVGEVVFGSVAQASDAPNVARFIGLQAGLDQSVPAYTVARNCASGMQAVVSAAKNIMIGDYDVAIAGGTESMSNIPFVNRKMRFGNKMGDVKLIDSLIEGLNDSIHKIHMGVTAENLAEKYSITRQEQDEFAALSHSRAFAATRQKKFADEIAPIMIEKKMLGKKIGEEPITKDEGISPKSHQMLVKEFALYPTVFKENGTVTPANACPINDGAAAVILVSDSFYEAHKDELPEPMGELVAYSQCGVDPLIMGIGPAHAIPKVLDKAGKTLSDVDLFEINEAFAAQYLAVEKELELDRDKVNVNGGAIAIGHPVGTSGCRLIITLLNELKRQGKSLGVASLCIGGGQGMAVLVKKFGS